jgi:hypothetical protein
LLQFPHGGALAFPERNHACRIALHPNKERGATQ